MSGRKVKRGIGNDSQIHQNDDRHHTDLGSKVVYKHEEEYQQLDGQGKDLKEHAEGIKHWPKYSEIRQV